MTFKHKSDEHLLNIVLKSFRSKGIAVDEHEKDLLRYLCTEYYDIHYNGLNKRAFEENELYMPISRMTWEIKNNQSLVFMEHADNIKDILDMYKEFLVGYESGGVVEGFNSDLLKRDYSYNTVEYISEGFVKGATKEFEEDMLAVEYKSGVYFLYDKHKNLMYVGKSINLGRRVLGSISERQAVHYEYAVIDSKSDMNVYESYYISLLKPVKNVEGKQEDKLTIELPCIRNFIVKPIYAKSGVLA